MERNATHTLALEIALREGRKFPNSLDFLEATILEAGRESRESMEALIAEASEGLAFCEGSPRKGTGARAFRDLIRPDPS